MVTLAPSPVRHQSEDGLREQPTFEELISHSWPAPRIFRVRRGIRCAMWTSPNQLTVDSQDRLYSIMADLSPRIFGVDFSKYWEVRRRDGLFQRLARYYLFADRAGEVVGWASYQRRNLDGRRCIYFDITAILPHFHGAGVITDVESKTVFRELLLRPWGRTYLMTRTRNPRLYRSFQTALGRDHVYPAIGRRVPEHVRAIALAMASSMGQAEKLDRDEQKLVETYLPHLPQHYAVRPSSGDETIDRWFDASLGPADAFLVVAEATIWWLAAYRLRKLVRKVRRP